MRCNDVGKSVSAKPLIFGTKLGPRPLPQLGIMRLRSDIRMTIYTVLCVRLSIYLYIYIEEVRDGRDWENILMKL